MDEAHFRVTRERTFARVQDYAPMPGRNVKLVFAGSTINMVAKLW